MPHQPLRQLPEVNGFILFPTSLFIHFIIKSKDTKKGPGFLVILVMFRCPTWIALSSTIFKDSTNQHSRQAL
ncbi:hypothetical protein ACKLNR_002064 [Fusarium oxysporum f. sp. zingiberi]